MDELLETQGLARRVLASAPTMAAALCMAAATDLLVAVPRSASASLVEALQLRTAALPLPVPALPIVATWHRRHDGDPAHGWLREHLSQAVRTVLSEGAS